MSSVTIDLDEKHARLLEVLAAQMQEKAGPVIATALEVLAETALIGADQPPFTPEQIAAIEEGLAAIERGDVVSHETVFADMCAKFGR